MNTVIIIPARMASQRLPNKPTVSINGEPMIVHVWRRATEAEVGDVIVACDHEDIAAAIADAGGRAIVTHPDLPSGSDRVCAALQIVDPQGECQQVVNLQGDMPNLDPSLIKEALQPLRNRDVDIGTLAVAINDPQELANPSVVKIALSLEQGSKIGRALYFSRAPIPHGQGDSYHHIGIYAYKRQALEKFVQLSPSPLEQQERLEQLRALEAGMRIGVQIVDAEPLGVDTQEDLDKVRTLMNSLPPPKI